MSNVETATRPDGSGLPATIAPGSLLLATGAVEPAESGLCLQLLRRYGATEDAGIVVTTTGSAEETTETYTSKTGADPRPPIGIVDTFSRGQNLTVFHGEVPTVFTPGPPDIARVSVAIENVAAQLPSASTHHLVVRSMTPFFEADTSSTITHRIERTFGNWSEDGLVVLGVDFTAMDEPVMDALTGLADGVVRLAASESGQPTLAYRGTSPRRPSTQSDTSGRDE